MDLDDAQVVDTDIWPNNDAVYRGPMQRDYRELMEALRNLEGIPRVLFFGSTQILDSLSKALPYRQTNVYKGDRLEDVAHLFEPATAAEFVTMEDGPFINPLPIRNVAFICSLLRLTSAIDRESSLVVSRQMSHSEATMQHAYATSPVARRQKVRLFCAYKHEEVGPPSHERCYTLKDNVCKHVFIAMSKWPAFAHSPLVLQVPGRQLLGALARRICKIGLAWQAAPTAGIEARYETSTIRDALLGLKREQPRIFKR